MKHFHPCKKLQETEKTLKKLITFSPKNNQVSWWSWLTIKSTGIRSWIDSGWDPAVGYTQTWLVTGTFCCSSATIQLIKLKHPRWLWAQRDSSRKVVVALE